VTSVARAGVVIGRTILQMAGLAFHHVHVIKLKGVPTVNDVAALTISGKVIGVDGTERQFVTTDAVHRSVGVLPIAVTSLAGDLGVSAGQGKEIVRHVLAQKRDGHGLTQRRVNLDQRDCCLGLAQFFQGLDFAAQSHHRPGVEYVGGPQGLDNHLGLDQQFVQPFIQVVLFIARGVVDTADSIIQSAVEPQHRRVYFVLRLQSGQIGQTPLDQL